MSSTALERVDKESRRVGSDTVSPLDEDGLNRHKRQLLLDRLCRAICKRGPQGRPGPFFVAIQDFNGLRGFLRGPIVFADVRTLKAFFA